MKYLFSLLGLLLALTVYSQDIPKENQVRRAFLTYPDNEGIIANLYKKLSDHDLSQRSTLLGYQGAAQARLAEFAVNPYTKLNKFTEGRKTLEQAIQMDPENYELRYLRFLIQTNCPAMLGYSSDIPADKELIMNRLANTEKDTLLWNNMTAYLLKTNHCTPDEKDRIRTYMEN